MRNDFPLAAKEMHLSFEGLTITNAPILHAFFMDIRHNTSLRSILEDDFISSTSKVWICSYSSKGQGYGWLLSHLFVRFASCTLFSPYHCVFISV
jgi:hypothetical protein